MSENYKETQLNEKKEKDKEHFNYLFFTGIIYLIITIILGLSADDNNQTEGMGIFEMLFYFFVLVNAFGAWVYWGLLIGNYINYDNPEIKPIYTGLIALPLGILIHYLTGSLIHSFMYILSPVVRDYPGFGVIW